MNKLGKQLRTIRTKKWLSIKSVVEDFKYTKTKAISHTALVYYESWQRNMPKDVYEAYLAYLEWL